MLLYVLRGVFLLVLAGVVITFANASDDPYVKTYAFPVMIAALGGGLILMATDIMIPRKSLAVFSGVFFGIAMGLLMAWAFCQMFNLMLDLLQPYWKSWDVFVRTIKVLIGVGCCYLSVSFILQTKDDIRFVIPYVEFVKQTKGGHPLILDTSAIIDGRFVDICETGVIDSPIVVPRFVLSELQAVADSNDRMKRNRGRRGLDILQRLQTNAKLDVQLVESKVAADRPVDERLVIMSQKMDGRVVTHDYNLNKVAQLHGVTVININDLANALKPVFLPGEKLNVKVIRPGEGAGQGVGYLEDGTMVVIESGRDYIGNTIPIAVTSVLQTSAGRMVFGRLEGAGSVERGGGRGGRGHDADA